MLHSRTYMILQLEVGTFWRVCHCVFSIAVLSEATNSFEVYWIDCFRMSGQCEQEQSEFYCANCELTYCFTCRRFFHSKVKYKSFPGYTWIFSYRQSIKCSFIKVITKETCESILHWLAPTKDSRLKRQHRNNEKLLIAGNTTRTRGSRLRVVLCVMCSCVIVLCYVLT